MRETFHITDFGDHHRRKQVPDTFVTSQHLDRFLMSRRHRQGFDFYAISAQVLIQVFELPKQHRLNVPAKFSLLLDQPVLRAEQIPIPLNRHVRWRNERQKTICIELRQSSAASIPTQTTFRFIDASGLHTLPINYLRYPSLMAELRVELRTSTVFWRPMIAELANCLRAQTLLKPSD